MVSPFSTCIKISLVKSTKLSSLRLFNQSVAPGLILMVHRSFRWWPSAPIIHRKQHYLLRSSDQSQARRQEWSPNVINLYILSVCVCTVSVRNRNIMSAGRYNSVVLFVLRLTSYIVEPAISTSLSSPCQPAILQDFCMCICGQNAMTFVLPKPCHAEKILIVKALSQNWYRRCERGPAVPKLRVRPP